MAQYKVQPLGLTDADMAPLDYVDSLNSKVESLLSAHIGLDAEQAINQIADAEGMLYYDETDPADTDGGYVKLYARIVDGRREYLTVWFVSAFGAAADVTDPESFRAKLVGFDCQPLGWARSIHDE